MMFDADAVAADLVRQHATGAHYVPLACPGLDMVKAYTIQDRLIASWTPDFGPVASWKVGLTTARMQEMCGVDQPIAGAVFANRIHRSSHRIESGAFVRLGIEAEMAFRISSTPDPNRVREAADMRGHIDAACAAFEIIEDRNADYTTLDAASMVADNSWNAGIILGAPVPLTGRENLLDLEGLLLCNGETIGTGLSQDAGGDPLAILAWLVKSLGERGRALEPGQWVMTGSVVRTHFPSPGERLVFQLGDMPPVETMIG